jgi:DNA-binding transcriptional ArsR family regulator
MSSRQSKVSGSVVAPIFAALGDPTRLLLVSRLCTGHARSITQLTKGTGLTRQGISKHLAILQEAGVVTSCRVGRETHIAICTAALDKAAAYIETASHQWDDAIARLKLLVEE